MAQLVDLHLSVQMLIRAFFNLYLYLKQAVTNNDVMNVTLLLYTGSRHNFLRSCTDVELQIVGLCHVNW